MEVRLPALAENVSSGVVVNILVSEGDWVEQDQEILELETDKAMAAVPAPESGTISKIHVKEGDEVSAGQVIFTLSPDSAGKKSTKREPSDRATEPKKERREVEEEEEAGFAAAEEEKGKEQLDDQPLKPGLGPPASPSIRKLARQLSIDLTRVRGTERGGRIVLDDLRAYVERLQQLASGREPEKRRAPLPDFARWGYVRKEPMSRLRKTISEAMSTSRETVPQVTQFGEADISNLVTFLSRYSPQYEKLGARLTLTGVVMKALVAVLKKYPIFNSSLDEDAGVIVFKNYFHLGIAVDTEQGLIVPVLRDVDRKDLLSLSKELAELAEKARDRKISLEDLQGATFTISNQGGIGGSYFTPIIHLPEVAILGLGRAGARAVVVGKAIEARTVLPLSLSYDHRVADGGDAARFIRDLADALENFSEDQLRVRADDEHERKEPNTRGKTR